MKAAAELQLIPIGEGLSLRGKIQRVVDLLGQYDFIIESHASGTNIEGELSQILQAVERVHEAMHNDGVVRIVSFLKLETRTDKEISLAGKRL